MPARVFISYDHDDEQLCLELQRHLKLLQRQGLIDLWNDRQVLAGSDRHWEVAENLSAADLILLLVSPSYLASDSAAVEMSNALAQQEAKRSRVIPIILRPADMTGSPIQRLVYLPRDGRPVVTWRDRDEAWLNVAQGIRQVAQALPPAPAVDTAAAARPVPAAPLAATSPASASAAPRPTPRSLRNLLYQVLPGTELDAFCQDNFPDVKARFRSSMDQTERVSLLMERADPEQILKLLRRDLPDAFERHRALLQYP